MQSKQTSNPGQGSSRWDLAIIPLAAVLVFGLATKLHAEPPRAPAAAERAQQMRAPEPVFGHVADADRDVGPGEAESILAQHP